MGAEETNFSLMLDSLKHFKNELKTLKKYIKHEDWNKAHNQIKWMKASLIMLTCQIRDEEQ